MAGLAGIISGAFEGLQAGGGMMNQMNVNKEKLRQGAEGLRQAGEETRADVQLKGLQSQKAEQEIQLNKREMDKQDEQRKKDDKPINYSEFKKDMEIEGEQGQMLDDWTKAAGYIPDALGNIKAGDLNKMIQYIGENGGTEAFIGPAYNKLKSKLNNTRSSIDAYLKTGKHNGVNYSVLLEGLTKGTPEYEQKVEEIMTQYASQDTDLASLALQNTNVLRAMSKQDLMHGRLKRAESNMGMEDLTPVQKQSLKYKQKSDERAEKRELLTEKKEAITEEKQSKLDKARSVNVEQAYKGKLDPLKVGGLSAIERQLFFGELGEKYPNFNTSMADANFKYMENNINMRAVGQIQAITPRMEVLEKQAMELTNKNIRYKNMAWNELAKQKGKAFVTNYDTNVTAMVLEINQALSNTSVASDYRVKWERENLKNAGSPAQLLGAMANLRRAMQSRFKSATSPMYPWDVVRGERTLEQWQNDMVKEQETEANKIANDYGVHDYEKWDAENKKPSDKESNVMSPDDLFEKMK